MKRILVAIPALMIVLVATRAQADEPHIFLSWHAPWGFPRATDTLISDCDTTRSDTLWLSFDSGKASPTYLGFQATLLFHPAPGDTLLGWWTEDFEKGKPPFFQIELEPVPGLGYPQPYRTNGAGGTKYDGVGPDARYRMIYATPLDKAIGIQRGNYVLARLVIRRPPAGNAACGKPLCIEWADAHLSFGVGADQATVKTGPHRFVSLNSPGGAVAVPYRRAAQLNGWKLKGP